MKGSDSNIELEEAKNAINVLGGKLEKVINFELPDNAGSRTLIVIKKVSNTKDKYPRAFARIKERPL